MYMEFKGFTYAFSLWTFILRLASVCTDVKGQSQLIGSSQPVVATEGGDVVLPCHVEPPLDVEQLTVEWWRPDLPPDPLGRYRYVHLHHDGRDVEDMKLSSFTGRTMLFRDELKHGNLSLKIMKVTLSDQGWYTCVLPQLKSPHRSTDIRLDVEPNPVQTTTTEKPLEPGSLQTTEEETDVNAAAFTARSRWIPVACAGFLILVVGVVVVLLQQNYQNQEWGGSLGTDLDPEAERRVLAEVWTIIDNTPPPHFTTAEHIQQQTDVTSAHHRTAQKVLFTHNHQSV